MRIMIVVMLIIVSLFAAQPVTAQNNACRPVYPAGNTEVSAGVSGWITANASGLPALHALIGCATWIPLNSMQPTFIQVRIDGKAYASYIRGDSVIVVSHDRLLAVNATAWQDAVTSLFQRRYISKNK